MNKTQQTEMLERRLTELFGKKSYTPFKHACRGKYRGYYDYGLSFEDETRYAISLGRKNYPERLAEAVNGYQYYYDNKEYLARRTNEIIERDNKQALDLGLSPIEFVGISLETRKDARNLFWVGFMYKQNGQLFWHTETAFFYACRGIGLKNENSVETYFDELVNRPDDRLGLIDQVGQREFNAILLGHLHKKTAEASFLE